MEKLKKLLFPHPVLTVLLSALSGAALTWIFGTGRELTWYAYPVYSLSAYSLTLLLCWLIPWAMRKSREEKKKPTEAEAALDFHKSLVSGFWMNILYGGFQLTTPWFTGSIWDGSQGAYQLVMALIHLVLLRYERKMAAAPEENRLHIGWQGFGAVGNWLFILHLTMTGLVFQTIWDGETENYPGVLIFAVAAYTFYKLIMAIIRVVQYKKNANPLVGAAKNVDMSEALLNLYNLQAAMLSVFAQPGQEGFRFLMNTLVGVSVCVSTIAGAVGMIRHSIKCK